MKNGNASFWLDTTRDLTRQRPRIDGDLHADVVIVGGGFTGLWTAYWTKKADPSKHVVILEREHIGFGASGRNGGWITGKTVGLRNKLADNGFTRADVLEMERTCQRAVFEIDDLMRAEGKDIDAARGGWMQIARSDSERERLKDHLATDREWGLTEDEVRFLDAAQTRERINVPGVRGAIYSPYSVRCHPAKLVYAIAELCEDLGVTIYENTAVVDIDDGVCTTTRGSVSGDVVVLATEAYTADLPGRKRNLLPMISSMVITDPLPDEAWETIGWDGSECMSGAQHMYFYSQRTADGRIALGGRGVPYLFNSGFDHNGELDTATITQLTDTVQGLFPRVPMTFAHAWRGVLGVPRDWSPFIDHAKHRRLVQVGGYAGQGVTASYVAGRIVADLVHERETEHTAVPWVRSSPRNWEVEPLRWIGSHAVRIMYGIADGIEHRLGGTRTSRIGSLATKISGRS